MSVLERFPVGAAGHRTWRPERPWDTDRAVRNRVYTPSTCVADPVVELVVPERNHFDLPLGLGDPADMLGCAVLAQMGLIAVTERTAVTERECG